MQTCVTCMGLGAPGFTFRVPRRVTSQNTSMRQGMFAYKRERDAWIRDLTIMARSGAVDMAKGRRIVRITRLYAGRCQAIDYGNLVGGLKPAVDAMQREIGGNRRVIKGAGIIVDDSPSHFIGIYQQERAATDEVMFEVWDVRHG